MINEQEEKLNHLSEEMENLRSQHPSAFKNRSKNSGGSIRDFSSNPETQAQGPIPTYNSQQ